MKWLRENLEFFLIAGLLFGVIFAASSFISAGTTEYYPTKLFDQSIVHTIRLSLSETDLASLLANPKESTRYHVSVQIDGEDFSDVALSTHGNASLFSLANSYASAEDDTSLAGRFSYKLKFNRFHDGQTYYGLDELVLSNLNADPSGMRDYLAYDIMRAAGAEAPLAAYTEVYLNDELKGLYLAIEEIDASFLERNHASPDTTLYKPEALAHDYSARHLAEQYLAEGEALDLVTDSSAPGFDNGGSDLRYRGSDPSDYPAIFDHNITKVSPKDRQFVLDSLRSLAPESELAVEEILSTSTLDPENYWDIDALVRYFAAHNFVINVDSYTGWTAHNYILKSSPAGSTLLPWDYNLAFQGLWLDVTPSKQNASTVHEWDIDELIFSTDSEPRPLWNLIVSHPEYKERYHAALQSLLDNYFASGSADVKIIQTAELIRPYLEADPTKFYTLEEFDDEVSYLRRFVFYRADSIQKQLWQVADL
ncbi:CotH kinase family protein [Candidatus Saccharibacteria bacterium]|nr:CotH kinase family protein [Candidatus Saccharibacteria bacterium]